MAKKQKLGVTVKETIDNLYSSLVQFPDGVVFSAKATGSTPSRIISILVSRGIVEMKHVYTKNGQKCRYRWAVDQKPTSVLYGSITQELRDKTTEYNRKFYAKKKADKAKEEPILTPDEPRIEKDADTIINELAEAAKRNPLEIYGIDELWNEIKRRGCTIEDNHLVLVKKVVFD